MTKNNKVLIEEFNGFKIYYNKENDRFVADKPDVDIHFEQRTLWDIKGLIKNSNTEEVNKEYLIISGYFGKQIAKIILMTKNKLTQRCKYKIIEDTNNGYDTGRIFDNQDIPKLYNLTEHNLKLFEEVKKLEKNIKDIESEQKKLVKRLKN